jgi:hypothetical protein
MNAANDATGYNTSSTEEIIGSSTQQNGVQAR